MGAKGGTYCRPYILEMVHFKLAIHSIVLIRDVPDAGDALDGTAEESRKNLAFKFRQRHLILMLRQILGDNPFEARDVRDNKRRWQSITETFRDVGIAAQARSLKLKRIKPLDEHYQSKKNSTTVWYRGRAR